MSVLKIDFNLIHRDSTTGNTASGDQCKIRNIREDSDIIGFTRLQIVITDGTVDQSIPLPGTTSDYLILLTDREVSIKINGSNDSQNIKPLINTAKSLAYFRRGDLTSLTISNSSGEDAYIDILIADK